MTADGYAGVMVSMMPFILIIDYLLRFIFQTTPGVMVKPYILQPISRYTAIECFLISSHFSGYNFLWLAMFLPYSIIILIAGAGFWPVLIELVGCQLFIMLNSQIYLFFRTFINRNVLWFLASMVFYMLFFWPLLMKFNADTFGKMLDLYATFGRSGWLLPVLIACPLSPVQIHLRGDFQKEGARPEAYLAVRLPQPFRIGWRIPEDRDQVEHAQQGHAEPLHLESVNDRRLLIAYGLYRYL